jgi:hypothetical protein
MRHTPRFRRRSAVFRLERLEERTVLSPLIVTSGADSGPGSLRATIASAPSGSVIEFATNVHNITLTTGELGITLNLDIEGPGANKLTISGNNQSRVFDITGGTVTIAGLTLADGLTVGQPGDPTGTSNQGGGVLNHGDLTLLNDVLANNQALGFPNVLSGAGFPGGASGGGIANLGTLTATGCQFTGNQAIGANDSQGFIAGVGRGGALANTSNATLGTVIDCQFTGNVAQGGSDCTGQFAGVGLGGAISNASTIVVQASTFRFNQAIGGDGNGGALATGGGVGGAIATGNPLSATNLLTVSGGDFDHNQAVGGNGNTSSVPYPPSLAPNTGGGGAIVVIVGSGSIDGSTLEHNQALGGPGTTGSNPGSGVGGALDAIALVPPVDLTVTNCTIDHNNAVGGAGGLGEAGGAGLGGGIADTLGTMLTVGGTTVDHNKAQAGDGGAGGNGYGGGLYKDASSTLTLTSATVQYNFAVGGAGGSGGSDGQGIGGGVYAIGTFSFDSTTVINKNHASTSNDNIGP